LTRLLLDHSFNSDMKKREREREKGKKKGHEARKIATSVSLKEIGPEKKGKEGKRKGNSTGYEVPYKQKESLSKRQHLSVKAMPNA